MSVRRSELGRDTQMAAPAHVADTVRAGLLGGLVGGVSIWIYEAIVWVGVQRLMPLAGIPRNATGLVFGKEVQEFAGALRLHSRYGNSLLFLLRLGRALRFPMALFPAARL